MSSPEKKAKLENKSQIFENIVLYVVCEGIGPKRCEAIKCSAKMFAFQVADKFHTGVTHVISDLPTKDEVLKVIKTDVLRWRGFVLSIKWFSDSVRAKKPVLETPYLLPSRPKHEESNISDLYSSSFSLERFNYCIPQRRATLGHPNKPISEALDFLGEYWEVIGKSLTDENRALAFRRAAAAVKCLPFKAERISQLEGIKDLGEGHAFRVASDIVEEGSCTEVEEKRKDPRFISLQAFCKVFGVGPSMASRWYDYYGLQTVDDLKRRFAELGINNEMIIYGTAFYDDLNTPLMLENDGQKIRAYVEKAAQKALPGVSSKLIGGFRRGKKSGHDLDLLFTYHKEEGRETGLVGAIRDVLKNEGLVVWSRAEKSFDQKANASSERASSESGIVDRLELCMTIMKLPLDSTFEDFVEGLKESPTAAKEENRSGDIDKLFQWANTKRPWRAVRVDFVSAPASQFAYALMGWTGNKQYNRCLRQYAKDEFGYILGSAGLWDTKNAVAIPAESEHDIFRHLKLDYREPWERNF